MENMELWNKLNRPPKRALKQIAAGRLKGKTDVSPQWRYEAMTDQFGPCGLGWKYEVTQQQTIPGPDGQVFVFVDINLYVQFDGVLPDGEWSAPIPGNGGSMLVAKESAGLHANDEAFKMATTDALGTAMKLLGVAADIYAGLWDGSKYKDSNPPSPERKATPASTSQAPPTQTGDECGGNPHYDPPSRDAYTAEPAVNEDALKKTIHEDIKKELKAQKISIPHWMLTHYGPKTTEKSQTVDMLKEYLADLRKANEPFKEEG